MIKTAVSWILIENKKILLIKRWTWVELCPWMWFVPWWKWEENETPEDTIIREIKEEINLSFEPIECFQNIEDCGYDVYKFILKYSWNIVIQESEIEDYWWFKYLEAKSLSLAFDMDQVLDDLNRAWVI